MLLSSNAIREGEPIALDFAEQAAGGENKVPDLTWTEAPEGTKSFAITVYDPDAPTGSGFWHWIAFDIPADTTGTAAGTPLPEGSREWMNDYGYKGYGGPCPPEGRIHRYQYTIHALDSEKLDVPDEATNAQARFAILASQIEAATLTGKFKLPDHD